MPLRYSIPSTDDVCINKQDKCIKLMNDNGFMDMTEDKPHYVALELRTKA